MITNPRATSAYSVPTAMPATRNCRKSFTRQPAFAHQRAAWRPFVSKSGGWSRVHALDQVFELPGDGRPLDLLRRRELALLLVELARQQLELLDRLDLREVLVDLVDGRLDEGGDLGLRREVGVGRERHAVLRCPVADRVELDADEGRQVLASVAEDDRLLDVRR